MPFMARNLDRDADFSSAHEYRQRHVIRALRERPRR